MQLRQKRGARSISNIESQKETSLFLNNILIIRENGYKIIWLPEIR